MADNTMIPDVVVRSHGAVSDDERAYAHDKVARAVEQAPAPVLHSKVDLVRHADPSRERPVFAKAELDVNGRVVRAHAAAPTAIEAVDAVDARLRERIEHFAHVEESRHLRHRHEASWHHGDEPTPRRSFFPRPVDERELVRRKTFAVGAQTPEDAAVDLVQLDHDFFLFRNRLTEEDNLLFRSGNGLALVEPFPGASPRNTEAGIASSPLQPGTMELDDAIALLDGGDEPFVFFLDATDGRGSVAYRRYDGHYGLIEPSSP
jgi:ribosome-associated translation inhibitor RaiA